MNRGVLTNLILGAAIALLPLFIKVSSLDLNRTSKDNLFVVLVMALLVIMPEKVRRAPVSVWALFIYVLLNLVLNQHDVLSLNVMFQTFYIVSGLALFVGYYERFDKESLELILNGASIGCLIQSVVAVANVYGLRPYHDVLGLMWPDGVYVRRPGLIEVVGTLGTANMLGSYLALTALTLFRSGWCYFIPLAIAAIIASKSSMALAAFTGGAFYFWFIRNHSARWAWVLYAVSTISMVAAYFTGLLGEDSGRFRAWGKIFSLIDLKHFIFGMGPGWFPDQRIVMPDGPFLQEHSGFISIFNVLGVTGCLLVMMGLSRSIRGVEKNAIFGSVLFASFLNSYGHFTSHQSTVAILIIITASICLAEGNNDELNLQR